MQGKWAALAGLLAVSECQVRSTSNSRPFAPLQLQGSVVGQTVLADNVQVRTQVLHSTPEVPQPVGKPHSCSWACPPLTAQTPAHFLSLSRRAWSTAPSARRSSRRTPPCRRCSLLCPLPRCLASPSPPRTSRMLWRWASAWGWASACRCLGLLASPTGTIWCVCDKTRVWCDASPRAHALAASQEAPLLGLTLDLCAALTGLGTQLILLLQVKGGGRTGSAALGQPMLN